MKNQNTKKLDMEALAQLAKAATDDVQAEAIKNEKLLPVWKDGKVVYVSPDSDETSEMLVSAKVSNA